MAEITEQQMAFIDLWMVNHNGEQSAVDAGYSKKSAKVIASRLLRKPHIAKEIARRQGKLRERSGIDAQFVLNGFAEVFERCMQHEAVTDKDGKPVGEYNFNASGANTALTKMGDHIGFFTKEDRNHNAADVSRLSADMIEGGLRSLLNHIGETAPIDITPDDGGAPTKTPAPKTLGHRQ
jgi:phage terminase small subunit